MSTLKTTSEKMSNYRWIICSMLFFATTVNYLDRQVLSLTWKDFIAARIVLAVGESGNFPAAIKVTAEYFPKKDRAFSTSIFNAGATVGALIAPVSIPSLASYFKSIGVGNGWEMAFIVIGALGFIWMGLWLFVYKKPQENTHVNAAELAYIQQDKGNEETNHTEEEPKLSLWQCFKYRQTWAVAFGKFLTDGVWWFFLFWTPAYISDVYGFSSDSPTAQLLIFVLYAITMLSIYGGKLPTIIINKTGKDPYAARMRAMLIFAIFPLFALFAQPLGNISYWFPVIIIGIAGAAHQSWSANIYSVGSDMFPKSAVATIIGIGGMAGGVAAFLINMCSGILFDYAEATQMTFLGFQGKEAGYFIIFCICAVAYLIAWCIMKALVPKYELIKV